jgi:multidrug efflux system membrane fusion protein
MTRQKILLSRDSAHFFKILLLGLGILTILGLAACSGKKEDPAKARRERVIPVTVTTVEEKTVPVQLLAIGNVEPLATIAIKSRVTGELKQVHFREGQDVSQGTLLFTLDPDPFDAELKKAQATLAKNMALAHKAEEDLRRYSELIKKEYVSREQFDQATTNLAALNAQIKADQAAVEAARLQVTYCYIKAPITGRTGSLLAFKGNMIKANDDNKNMVVINQNQPIYCSFALPEKNLADLKKYSAAGKIKVEAIINKDQGLSEEGAVSFIDNTVDKGTGTILVKGLFANKDKRLWPGQFVNIKITLTTRANTLLLPTQAVQTGLEGQYVFVIKPDQKAEIRPVVIGQSLDGKTVIEKGVKAGEVVVTDGQFQLISGTKVQVKKGAEDKGAARP